MRKTTVTVSGDRLATARQMRDGWMKAEKALMTAQEYRLGSRTLRRVDLGEIAARIDYWDNEIARLESGSASRIRVQRVVPRDI